MVRFLRNATVAKIAGKDSSLLQVSSEERERVARVAEMFGEEDLTRHLQIMLRTHGELGYKQEQRFHLELGLLKMAHAQKLLPIEQLLSDVAAAPATGAQRPPARPAIVGSSPALRILKRAAQSRLRLRVQILFLRSPPTPRAKARRGRKLVRRSAAIGPRIVAAASTSRACNHGLRRTQRPDAVPIRSRSQRSRS